MGLNWSVKDNQRSISNFSPALAAVEDVLIVSISLMDVSFLPYLLYVPHRLFDHAKIVCVLSIIVVRPKHLPVLENPHVRVTSIRCFHFFESQGRKPVDLEKVNTLRSMTL